MLRLTSTLALLGALSACAYAYNVTQPAPDGSTVALAPGQSASLANGRLQYVRLANDSRCAPDVQCVWAGDAVIELQWLPDGGSSRTLTLHRNQQAGPNQAALEGRRVTFTGLARSGGEASLRIDRTD